MHAFCYLFLTSVPQDSLVRPQTQIDLALVLEGGLAVFFWLEATDAAFVLPYLVVLEGRSGDLGRILRRRRMSLIRRRLSLLEAF